MNRYLVMVVLKPDIKEKRINAVQSGILNLFELNTKVRKVWYLGKNTLDFQNKDYNEGIFIKLDVSAKDKKIEYLRGQLRKNQDVLSSFIANNESENRNRLSSIKIRRLPFHKKTTIESNQPNYNQRRKVHMLVSKNIRLPFSEADIIAISEDEEKILESANQKLREYIYVKGYNLSKDYKNIKDIEKEFKKLKKMQFTFGNNTNVGLELVVQERNLI